jgi:phospholipid/cholesterol/gamma-HCH transport system substrate-binding protein
MSDYEARQARRNQLVGVFVLVGLLAFVWLIFRFGDLPSSITTLTSYRVYAQFASAPGVQRDTPIRFCGYQVGRVTLVTPPQRLHEVREGQLTGPEYYQVTVVMSIENRYTDIPLDSRIRLMTRGFGSSYISIEPPADPCVPARAFLVEGSRVEGSVGVTSELFPEQTQKQLGELVVDLRRLIGHADQLIGDPNVQQNVRSTLANLSEASKRTIGALDRADQALAGAKDAIEQYRQLAVSGKDTLAGANDKMERLTVSIVRTSDEVGQAATQLRQLMTKVTEGDGTIGRLVNDGRFYEDLVDTTEQLQVLIQEFTGILEKLDEKGISGMWSGSKR